MANFMGPMAPPQAAAPQPAQLDIRTNPSQRAQFKSFMQGMQVQPTTAPIAPMLPAPMPSPMDQVDIFAPVPMANPAPMPIPAPMPMQNGIMGAVPFEDGGPVRMQRGGVTFKSGESFESGRGIAEQQRERAAAAADAVDYSNEGIEEAMRDAGFGDPFDRPSGTDDDGSRSGVNRDNTEPVADALATIAAMDADQANFVPGSVPTGSGPLPDMRTEDQKLFDSVMKSNERVQSEVANFMAENAGVNESDGNFAGISPVASVDPLLSGPQDSGPSLLDLMDPGNVPNPFLDAVLEFDRKQRDALSEVESLIGPQPTDTGPADTSIIDFLNRNPQPADPLLMTGTAPLDDFLARNPQPRETDPINPLGQLMAGDVVYNRGKDSERTVNRLRDLENRMGVKRAFGQEGGLGALAEPILSKVTSAAGGAMATNIFDNVVNKGRTPIVAADTNQIVGYVGDGPFGKVYTGRPDYNPFGADGSSYTIEEGTGAYIVDRQQPNQGDSDERAPRALQPLPAAPTKPPAAPPPPNMIVRSPDAGTPATPPNVVVPSPRGPVTVNVPRLTAPVLTASSIDPIQPVGLPQSFLDLLASFNRPAPRAMQDGGAVLDQAADNFLEALKVA